MCETLHIDGKDYSYVALSQVEGADRLSFSHKVLLENVLRCVEDKAESQEMANRIFEAAKNGVVGEEVSFFPARVLFQDFTGVPVFVDFAAMRQKCAELGGNAEDINPIIPCDLVIDHSVIADSSGTYTAIDENSNLEYERNSERYEFLKWAQSSFENVEVTEPGKGICHQLNIERFAKIVNVLPGEGIPTLAFDTLVGSDSHTPTANGLGILGWGVGGIEAEAASLGQPITTLVPKVVGIHMTGKLSFSATAMDVALTLAEKLRSAGVVGCFVECFGEGIASLSATQRACISNMTPEYGCTCTLFPVDNQTLDYMRLTGRDETCVHLIEKYCRAQGFLYEPNTDDTSRMYSKVIDFDLSEVGVSLAGPARPHERLEFSELRGVARKTFKEHGCDENASFMYKWIDDPLEIKNGTIAIAAITSCTTTADAAMMIEAGIIARNAAKLNVRVEPWVKAIFAPGSHSTTKLLQKAGLLKSFEEIGFNVCGYGCMSCIGNSGPLSQQMHEAASHIELASVLSGNRNFEGRISPDVSQNYLMSPANVVLMGIAGSVDCDLYNDVIAVSSVTDDTVLARDLLPKPGEVEDILKECLDSGIYTDAYVETSSKDERWDALKCESGSMYRWDSASTYVQRPTFFDNMSLESKSEFEIKDAFVLAKFEDFITTDHISPAGAISLDSPAAEYLRERGVKECDFNTYGSRRGNHEVMMRATFANVKLENKLADGRLGGYTLDAITGEVSTIFDAAMHYMENEHPCVILAGKMYGSGSSRDWAAKGPALLGVKAVIAESFERIHRSNLVGMGILPLQFMQGQSASMLGLDGRERYSISNILFDGSMKLGGKAHVSARKCDGTVVEFDAIARIDTLTERKYFEAGGILQYVLRNIASKAK